MSEVCVTCGGKLALKRVELVRRRGDEIYLFKEVPAKICGRCGERYFAAGVVGCMDDMIRGHMEAIAKIETTVLMFPKEKEAA